MCLLRSKFLSCKLKWIRAAVLVTIVSLLPNCDSGQSSQVPDQQIRNVNAVSTVIASNDDSLANITVGKITFETISNCTTSVEINGKHYDAGKGTLHSAYVHDVYDNINRAEYTIYATTYEGIEFRQNGILAGEFSGMFGYSGELGEHLDYLVPVVISIYEEYKDSGGLLDVLLLGGIDYFSLFQKENVFSMDETTSRELYDSFSGWYEANRSVLRSAWPFFSDDQIKAASILNIVSYLWHFGNFERIERPGCVQVNELIGADSGDFIYAEYEGEEVLYWRTAVGMGDYIKSMIGCCTDHAFLTKALLEEAGFESRRVKISGHWLTEVLTDSYWYTIDASAGVMVNASTESMVQGTKRTAYLFFTPYMHFESEDHYASAIYPWFPTVSVGAGLDGDIVEESEFEVISGYFDNPPFQNELEQLNGR